MRRLLLALCGALSLWALLPASSFAAPAPTTHDATSGAKGVKAGKIFYPTLAYVRQHPEIGKSGSLPLTYYDGPVMPNVNIYVVFWGTGFSTAYKTIVTNYFTDVGSTSFENVLNQYYDTSTHIHNSVTLKATWSDTSTPPTADTCVDGLSQSWPAVDDSDIQTEVSHAISTEGWANDHANGLYFVYTQPNDYIDAGGTCSYTYPTGFCAYHSYTGFTVGSGVAYAAMPFPTPPSGSADGPCYGATGQTYPNGDTNGDAVINVSSHEQFEAQSDQAPNSGWIDTNGQEIGDKCAWTFPGGSVTNLNNSHSYSVQLEYSNADSGCVNTFTTPAHWPSTGGVFRNTNGNLYLKLANSTGNADMALTYGLPGDKPVVGDWTGKGYKSIGIFRNGTFYLRNSNTTGNANIVVPFGAATDIPVAGDWTGKGYDSIGVYRPSTSTFYLRNSNTAGPPDIVATLGINGDLPIVGDWTAQGKDTIGVFRPSNGIVYLRNSNTTGPGDINFVYGIAGDKPVVGDWDGNGTDTVGVDRNGHFLLRNSNTTGPANISYYLGNSTDLPIAGLWIAP